MEMLTGEANACTDVKMALVMTETVDGGAEDITSKELFKLFLVRRGGMTAQENAMD